MLERNVRNVHGCGAFCNMEVPLLCACQARLGVLGGTTKDL